MSFYLQYKEAVWLLGAIAFFIILFLLALSRKKKIIRKIGEPRLVKELIRNYSAILFTLKFLILCFAFAAGVLALMNFRKPGGPGGERKGIDVTIALDVSRSMYATDFQPNRLEKAKEFAIQLMNAMPEDRIALVLFAGKAYLQMPLTTDHEAAKMFIATAAPSALPQQGTVISDAMKISAMAFNKADRRFKSVVLISDGEDHDMNALETAAEMAEQGINITTVGIGSPGGSPIIDPANGEQKKDLSGNVVISKLNEEELKQIAATTNGSYIQFQQTDEAVKNVLTHLSQIEKKAYTDISLMNFTTYFRWFTFPMFLLLLIEFFIPERKKIKL
jgi:Ca-activated chloride channel family protein